MISKGYFSYTLFHFVLNIIMNSWKYIYLLCFNVLQFFFFNWCLNSLTWKGQWELLGCWAIILVCTGYHGWLCQQIYFSQWWRLGLWDQYGFRLKAVLLRPHMAERKKCKLSGISSYKPLISSWEPHLHDLIYTSFPLKCPFSKYHPLGGLGLQHLDLDRTQFNPSQ